MAHHKDPPVTMHYIDERETQTPLAKQTLSKKVLEKDTTVHKPHAGDQDSLYERYTNYLERQGYVPESRDYREIGSRSLGEYRGPSVRV